MYATVKWHSFFTGTVVTGTRGAKITNDTLTYSGVTRWISVVGKEKRLIMFMQTELQAVIVLSF